MSKKILPGIFALAVLLVAGYGMNRSMDSYGNLSDMALKNVLALADGEDPEDPSQGEEDEEEGIIEKKVYEKVDYTSTTQEIIGGIVFKCTTVGVDCNGIGNIDCVKWSTTNCVRM